MSKFVLALGKLVNKGIRLVSNSTHLAFCCILVAQILAQDASGRRFCDRLFDDCRREQSTVGTEDDTVGFFNAYCGRHDRNWRKITRCELVRASCICKLVFMTLISLFVSIALFPSDNDSL